ncbi:MAG TPA: hydrogenase maturation nickel metallochaperone HypA [Gemmatimonadaceae bacterium]|nr:hydrogenase maturation nickel metallochaperone HypA [Gemmatimonadaceae bacterium]
MHELSIAQSIVEVVTAAIADDPAAQVAVVHLRIGRLAGIEAGALHFSYDLVVERTRLAGSRLAIEEVPVVIHCPTCDAARELAGIQRFRCPVCDTPSGDIRRGRELEVASIELAVAEEQVT